MITKFRAYISERFGLVWVRRICFDPPFIDFEWENEIGITQVYSEDLDKVELMQYTGLKDKNGVEIYEGDVLTLKYPRDRRYIVTAKVIRGTQISAMVLKFEDEFTTEEIPLYKISAEHNLEVLGNIYENPELLVEMAE